MSALLAVSFAACSGAPNSAVVAGFVSVAGAQYYAGAPPAPSDGPAIVNLGLSADHVVRGQRAITGLGTLETSSTAVLVYAEGDGGYWVLPAGVPDFNEPTLPTFSASLEISNSMPLGPRTFSWRASNLMQKIGEPRLTTIEVVPPAEPMGQLVVSLSWDTDSDIDLHVVTPSGLEIWSRNPSSFVLDPGSSVTPDPDEVAKAGQLDLDSNARCIIDGHRKESVIWQGPPPSGHYLVRVDTPSLCKAGWANWSLTVRLAGEVIGGAQGQVTPEATRGSHDEGAGILAAQFDVP